MNYEPNTQAQPYTTLGEQVDWYAEQGKVMVARNSRGYRCLVTKGEWGGRTEVIYLNSVLKRAMWDRTDLEPKPQQDILGFITLTDEVDL